MDFYLILQKIMEEQGLNIPTVARMCGLSDGTVRSMISRQQKNVALEVAFKLSKGLGVSLERLNGNEEKGVKKAPPISDEAMKLAKDYDDLDRWGQKQVRSTADIEAARVADQRRQAGQGEGEEPEGSIIHIPFRCSTQSASAGTGTYLGPEAFETIYVRENELTRRASFGVPVSGDSMEPRYHNGDILIIEGAEEIEPGEIGAFSVDGSGYVKELGDGELISLNPAYDPIPMTESTWCHGRVIGVLDPEWIAEE